MPKRLAETLGELRVRGSHANPEVSCVTSIDPRQVRSVL
jgi:hypothetical protein